MNLDEISIFITDKLSEYLDGRWAGGYATLIQLTEILPVAMEQDNPATLDLITGAMLRIITDLHNISHGRLGVNG